MTEFIPHPASAAKRERRRRGSLVCRAALSASGQGPRTEGSHGEGEVQVHSGAHLPEEKHTSGKGLTPCH